MVTFTVKHFMLDQESMMKQFRLQIKKGDLMIDDKCALVHKYLQHFQQKLLTQPLWGSARMHRHITWDSHCCVIS